MRREEFVPAFRGLLFDGSLRPATRALFLKVAIEARACGYLEVPGPEPLHVVLQRGLGDTAREWRAALAELTRGPRPKLVEERDADGVRILVVRTWADWVLDGRREEQAEPQDETEEGKESPEDRRRRRTRERQARFVQRQRASSPNAAPNADASSANASPNASASAPNAATNAALTLPSHTLPSDPRREEQGEGERDAHLTLPNAPANAPANARASRRKPEQPLPDDWQPSEAHRRIAAERGVSVEDEAAKMRDWAAAGAHRTRDWDARFRLWLRSANPRVVLPTTIPDSWQPSLDSIAKARAADPAFGDPATEVARFRDWARSKGERAADWDARFVAACASRARTRAPAHARPGRIVQSAEGAILRPPPPLPEGSGADLLAAWDAGMEA